MTDFPESSRPVHQRSGRMVVAGVVVVAMAAGFVGGRAASLGASGQPPLQVDSAPPVGVQGAPAVISYSPVVDRVAPAVVTVRVERQSDASRLALPESLRDFFGRGMAPQVEPRREAGLGSGVIVRSDGHILTNHHVIDGATEMRVDLVDGRTFPAKLVGTDAASDLAVLKIDARDLPTLVFGDSDRLKVGDVVLAFGNPLGVGQTVTMGIVGAKGRATGIGDGNYEDFLQTDAPINQGNSGGALVNLSGELVGINAQILSPTGGNIGLGFAIPSSMARVVTEQLATDGLVHRSKLGVSVQGVSAEMVAKLGLKDARGALVNAVEPSSPAERAGLEQGDVIVALDRHPIDDANALRNRVAGTTPGTSVVIDLIRGGKSQSKTARLVERDDPSARRVLPHQQS